MKCFDHMIDRIFSREPVMQEYHSPDGLVITVKCPFCSEYVDIEEPDESPPTGSHKSEGWCVWCGKRFVFYY